MTDKPIPRNYRSFYQESQALARDPKKVAWNTIKSANALATRRPVSLPQLKCLEGWVPSVRVD